MTPSVPVPCFAAPAWFDPDADTVILLDPRHPVACDVCGTTQSVWGTYTRAASDGPRLLRAAYCQAHLPPAWLTGDGPLPV
jgi:hypothetical protein